MSGAADQEGTTIDETLSLARDIADVLDDKKALDLVLLDVSEFVRITDVFVLATGTSNRHVKTLADEVQKQIKEGDGRRPLRVEGVEQAEWVLLDYGDVVVHLFQPQVRDFYGLERLWGAAPLIEWSAADSQSA